MRRQRPHERNGDVGERHEERSQDPAPGPPVAAVAAAGVSPANDWNAEIDTPRNTSSEPANPAAAPKIAGTTPTSSR